MKIYASETVHTANGSLVLADAIAKTVKKTDYQTDNNKVFSMVKSLNAFPLRISLLVLILMVSGCASLSMPFERPEVKLVSVKLLPSDGMEQRLVIGLRITNPNSVSLNLVGMKYSLSLQGFDLLSGVSKDIPSIGGYSDTSLEVIATVDWLNGIRLLHSLMSRTESSVSYELDAKLDPGYLLPAFHVTETGMINLAQAE